MNHFNVTFKQKTFQLKEKESVLDCLLRNKQDVLYSCGAGVCQTCIMRQLDGMPTEAAQGDIIDTLKAQGYFLACSYVPSADILIEPADALKTAIPASVIEKSMASKNVMILKVKPDRDIDWRAGQYMNLINRHGLARSYSIANDVGSDGYLELHIKLFENGAMSQYLINDNSSDIHIRGPYGSCFYLDNMDINRELILVCTGTGLSPLYGIAKDAIENNHKGKITLFHASITEHGLYYASALRALSAAHSNFIYYPCVLESTTSPSIASGDIAHILNQYEIDKSNSTVYICGAADFVQKISKNLFLRGVPSNEIHSDAFLPPKQIA